MGRKTSLCNLGPTFLPPTLFTALLTASGAAGHVLCLLMLSWHTSSLSENRPFWIAQTPSRITGFFGTPPRIGQFVFKSPGARGWHRQELTANFQ